MAGLLTAENSSTAELAAELQNWLQNARFYVVKGSRGHHIINMSIYMTTASSRLHHTAHHTACMCGLVWLGCRPVVARLYL